MTFDVVDQLASARQRRIVLALCVAVVLATLLALPLAGLPLTPLPHVAGIYGASAAMIDFATFWLLMSGQRRSHPQRIIAAAYLFSGLMALLHMLTFPGALRLDGSVLGTGNTVSWLFVSWRAGFPVFILWAVFVEARGSSLRPRAAPALVALLAVALALAAALAGRDVPALVSTPRGTQFNPLNEYASLLGLAVAALAVLLIFRLRLVRRSLYLWLVLVLACETLGVWLSLLGGARYTLAWYGARVEGLLASAVVLVLLATHLRELQLRLAASVDALRQRTDALQAEMQHREHAERQLAQSQKLEAVGQLAAGLAHDINNFMQVVGARTEIIRRRVGPSVDADVAVVRRNIRRAEQLTRQLLLVAGRRQLQPQPVALALSVAEFVEAFQPVLGPELAVRLDADAALWPVHVDPTELEVALANLLTNARDAMDGSGSIGLSLRNEASGESGERVRIEVSDHGRGIPAAALERVFEPFFTMKEAGRGSGLGLAQVRAFVQGSGGTIAIRSELGRGTTVCIELPRNSPAAPADAGAPIAAPQAAPAAGRQVLLVDDNQDVLEATSLLLTQAGYLVHAVQDAAAAQAIVDAGLRPDLLFSDIVAPGELDGLNLARRMRALHPAVRVVLASGFSSAASQARAEGFAVLQKPYEAQAMLKAIAG